MESSHDVPPACVFCRIVDGHEKPAGLTRSVLRYPGVVAFEPKDPVTPGHILVVPERHVPDATDDPALTGRVMEVAARLAHDLAPANIITSIGEAATQSVYHLHVHVVPRRENDGLALPWTATGSAGDAELRAVDGPAEAADAAYWHKRFTKLWAGIYRFADVNPHLRKQVIDILHSTHTEGRDS